MLISAPPLPRRRGIGRAGPVDRSPEVDLEQPPHVLDGHLGQLAIERHARIVDPGVDGAERLDGRRRQALDVLLVGHVGHDGPACPPRSSMAVTVSRSSGSFREQSTTRAPRIGRPLRGRQSDAAGAAGDHNDLILQPLQLDAHSMLLLSQHAGGPSPKMRESVQEPKRAGETACRSHFGLAKGSDGLLNLAV